MQNDKNKMLIGNSYPFSLIRRAVRIEPVSIEDVRRLAASSDVCSYWGHEGTVAAANALLGVDLRPKVERPAIVLSADGYPMLDGETFHDGYVCSPNYVPGFRPPISAEVAAEKIVDWKMLHIVWE